MSINLLNYLLGIIFYTQISTLLECFSYLGNCFMLTLHRVDAFVLPLMDVGNIQKIVIRNDNFGLAPDWNIHEVIDLKPRVLYIIRLHKLLS